MILRQISKYIFEIDLEYKEISYLCRKIRCMEYKNRIADQLLRDKLEAMGAVLIEGPKACGKTTTAEQQAKSVIYPTLFIVDSFQVIKTDMGTI